MKILEYIFREKKYLHQIQAWYRMVKGKKNSKHYSKWYQVFEKSYIIFAYRF